MNRLLKHTLFAALTAAGVALSLPAIAQDGAAPRISVDFKDARVRTALESLLRQAGVRDFVIADDVAGFVTMTLEDRTLEETLRLLARASSVPLAWSVEGGVYHFHARRTSTAAASPAPQPAPEPPAQTTSVRFETIAFSRIDPADLQNALGVRLLTQGARYGAGARGAQPSGGGLRLFGGNGGFGGNPLGNGNPFGGAGSPLGGGSGVPMSGAPSGGPRPGG